MNFFLFSFVFRKKYFFSILIEIKFTTFTSMAIHRAGSLKQVNKTHKHGKHRSKGQIDNENKGT